MDAIVTDAEIDRLIAVPKQLPEGYEQLFKTKPKLGHKESELAVTMVDGSKFVLLMRESEEDPLDFSAILCFDPSGGGKRLTLRRYNGSSHEHLNRIEGVQLPSDFHIHSMTERYQRRKGLRPEGYAEVTNRYGDLTTAMECLIQDCNFVVAEKDKNLFFQAPGDE